MPKLKKENIIVGLAIAGFLGYLIVRQAYDYITTTGCQQDFASAVDQHDTEESKTEYLNDVLREKNAAYNGTDILDNDGKKVPICTITNWINEYESALEQKLN